MSEELWKLVRSRQSYCKTNKWCRFYDSQCSFC